jgi:hypothetical protein
MTIRFNENNRTTTGEANELLGTTSDGKLPAVDGSQLTNLNIAAGVNIRSLTYNGAFGTVVTVNLARNNVYTVSSSGPNFTITSALRSSYVNGDLVYIVMYGNTWCSLVNSDTAAGTKLFVKGQEVSSWRFQQTRSTIKLRLTTHTNGALYAHVCEDLSILDDLTDVVDTHNSIPIGATLKYNPYEGKWKAKQNWMPKVLIINNNNAINYLTNYTPLTLGGSANYWDIAEIDLNGVEVENVPTSYSPGFNTRPPVTGWTEFFADSSFYDYDSFVVVLQITPNTPITLYQTVPSNPLAYETATKTFAMENISVTNTTGIKIHLPTPNAKWIGKKITFICDGINTNTDANLNGRRIAYRLFRDKSTAAGNSAYIDYGNGSQNAVVMSTTVGPEICNSAGNFIGNRGAMTLMLTDDTYYPLKPGSTGETTYANAKMWVQCPF